MKKALFFLFPLFLVLDFVSKLLALWYIPEMEPGGYPFGGIGIFSIGGVSFSLNYVTNTGAAWGLFSGHSGLLFLLRSLIILLLIFFVPKKPFVWLVVTGAVGNALDYCFYGHVIDFFHFCFWGYSFPVFNIADACISIGVLGLFFQFGSEKKMKMI